MKKSPIGVFDSGYGGLTILKELVKELPEYDFIYLGDNARAPYGPRSYETVYHYTLECVKWLFDKGCPLVVLACNTASAKGLRTIQQTDLPNLDASKRVLGVIRPTTESIGEYTKTRHVGILGTKGTVQSNSYKIEINHFFPDIAVHQHACPMWVPLVECGESQSVGADYFVQKELETIFGQNPKIDTLVLACTHYPALLPKILRFIPPNITILNQGQIVARKFKDYLVRHPEMDSRLSKQSKNLFFTTDSKEDFDKQGSLLFSKAITSEKI